MIQDIAQTQGIGNHHIEPLLSEHLHFHNHVGVFVLKILIIRENSFPIELRQAQDTLISKKKQSISISTYLFLSEKSLSIFYVDLIL